MDTILRSKILVLYEHGMSLREIGEKLHMSHESIRTAIPKDKIRSHRMGLKQMVEVYKAYQKTGSYQKTAEEFGLKRQDVYRFVKIITQKIKERNR